MAAYNQGDKAGSDKSGSSFYGFSDGSRNTLLPLSKFIDKNKIDENIIDGNKMSKCLTLKTKSSSNSSAQKLWEIKKMKLDQQLKEVQIRQEILDHEFEQVKCQSSRGSSGKSFSEGSIISKWKAGLTKKDIDRNYGDWIYDKREPYTDDLIRFETDEQQQKNVFSKKQPYELDTFCDKFKNQSNLMDREERDVVGAILDSRVGFKNNERIVHVHKNDNIQHQKSNRIHLQDRSDVNNNNDVQQNRVYLSSQSVSDVISRKNQHGEPTAANFLARQSFSRDLPFFSGNPLEWPMFYSYFKQSTKVCNYSNSENLCRLLKCLKGEAREAVVSLLIHPDNVDEVMESLEFMFGRSELIIKLMIDKAKFIKAPRENQLETILAYATAVKNLTAMLRSFNKAAHLDSPQLLEELVHKLPPSFQLRWGEILLARRNCNMLDFSDWLYNIAKASSLVTATKSSFKEKPDRYEKPERYEKPKSYNVLTHIGKDETKKVCKDSSESLRCLLCRENHSISKCNKFKDLEYEKRWDIVMNRGLCISCLGENHIILKCGTRRKCSVENCNRIHHPLLHKYDSCPEITNEEEAVTSCHTTKDDGFAKVLFKVVPVKLYGPQGSISTHAFIDEGSSVTLMEETIATKLGLSGKVVPLCLKWTGDTRKREEMSRKVNVEISGKDNMEKFEIKNVRTVSLLKLPSQSINMKEIHKTFPQAQGLPVDDLEHAIPQILIGMNHTFLGTPSEVRESADLNMVAAKTRLGWIIYGKSNYLYNEDKDPYHSFHICHCESSDSDLHDMTKRYFTTEEFGVKVPVKPLESVEDQRALEIIERTTVKIDNHYEIGLLWKYDEINLPESRKMAESRLHCIEAKMDKNPDFSREYNKKIDEYVTKGYARKLTNEEAQIEGPRTWYLPHFGVTNPNKPGKLRLVFDAASKSHGVSLNDVLLKGPDRYNLLLGILFKFREGTTGICGDICEMFHQVRIRNEDLSAQRFLWRGNDRKVIPDVYVMKSMIFGAICSPSCAQEIKNKNGYEHKLEFPVAAEAIVKKHYVDDYLDSFNSEEKAYEMVKQVTEVHAQGGFHITNWLTNSQFIVDKLEASSKSVKNLNFEDENCNERVLGMYWNTPTDEFQFKLQFHRIDSELLSNSRIPTKREVLRILMSVFDPIGFLANFTVYMKNTVQEIWSTGIGWDDEVPNSIYEKWRIWMQELPKVRQLRIPRCYSVLMPTAKTIQLHIFVDASEVAFAGVDYLRIESENCEIDVSFVSAKTRVAPQKRLSIPRLELQAAVLGSRLAHTIEQEHNIIISKRYFWSDSRTVLCWLRSDARKYKPFVGHRISEVLETTQIHEWLWVPSKMNAADDATKWVKIPEFNSNGRWLNGPEFLRLPESEWPKETIDEKMSNDDDEIKTKFVGLVIKMQPDVPLPDVSRFVHFDRLVRVTAWVMRYISNLYLKSKKETVYLKELSAEELRQSEEIIIKKVQFESYEEDITALFQGKFHKSSSLIKLTPYLDEKGVLRANGRIDAAPVAVEMRRPIILNGSHPLTKLIVEKYHRKYCHQFLDTVVNEVRQKYWIPNLRAAVKFAKTNCQYCKNMSAKPKVPVMGSLPAARVTPYVRPFTYTGLDYFGPIEVTVGRRHEKRWGVIFTCLTVRAIHIEIAHSLSTDSFIMALRNFTARRGCPTELFSDNGTNFKGAERELHEAIAGLDEKMIMEELALKNIVWKFNPPAAPHMGGAWERLIQSIKKVLKVLLKSKFPRDEVLRNLLMEAERVVNCRPLVHEPIDINLEEMLTPNHFLIGSSSGDVIETIPEHHLQLSKQWKFAQNLANHFWSRWVREYLPTLLRREKWHEQVIPVEIGNVVLIVDDNLPRNTWRKGIVLQVYRGKDGCVRVADVKTATGILKRPVVKLVVLDVMTQNLSTTKGCTLGENVIGCSGNIV